MDAIEGYVANREDAELTTNKHDNENNIHDKQSHLEKTTVMVWPC